MKVINKISFYGLSSTFKSFLIISLWVLLPILISSCGSGAGHQHEGVTYTCPMHPEIEEDEPGTCPICNMDLVEKASKQALDETAAYTCPMHPEIVEDEPGSCPICHMDLVRKEGAKHEHETAQKIEYTCPMHPEILKDAPGTCPICHMDLVKKESEVAHEPVSADLAELLKNPTNTVIGNIKTVKASQGNQALKTKINGVITYDTRQTYAIPAKFGGRIEQLSIRYNFQSVKKGEKLLEIYSPELVTAQKELLFLIKTDPDNEKLIGSAKKKLNLLGIAESQINQIIQSGKENYAMPVYSPYAGYVVEEKPKTQQPMKTGMNGNAEANATNMQNKKISLQEGMYVSEGQALFRVVSNTALWAEFDIYANQENDFQKGDPLTIFWENSDSLQARIDFVQPFFNETGSFKKVRVYLDDQASKSRVGQLVTAELKENIGGNYWLPKTAVYDLGLQKIAFEKTAEGVFKPVTLQTGTIADNQVEIRSSINPEAEYAYNASFLVDGESFIAPQALNNQ